MKLADISIRRPVFATMMILALVVLGFASYTRLGVDLFPNIDLPIVTVTTSLPGGGPEEVETSITKTIEEAVNTISGIDELRSTSYEGLSQIVITFNLEKDPDIGSQEVRDAVARVIRNLPEGTQQPVIQKFDPGATPVMTLVVQGNMPLKELTEVAKKRIKEPLETLRGVGKINMIGAREREIHVVVNPLKLAAYKLSIKQVKEALSQQNIEIPGGRIDQDRRELILRTMGRIQNPAEFEKVVIANVAGVPIRVQDIGHVEDTTQEPRTLSRMDDVASISLSVLKQSGTNTVAIIDTVKESLAEMAPTLPPGVKTFVMRDQSGFIKGSVHTVQEHLILGAILASLVVLLFMGSIRSTMIASLAIPTSIIATFILVDFAGFTLNNMTLLALALAVGVVIDDAIVVLENIFRHMEEKGSSAMQAAHEATQEIGLAVMATTLSLVIIFLPLAYMPGIVGRFLSSYGFTVAFAIMISLFVAFTLTPMLSSRFLKVAHGEPNRLQKFVDKLNEFLKKHYGRQVEWALAHRWVIVLIAVVTFFSTVIIGKYVGKDFLPPDDAGEFQITLKAPEGTSLSVTSDILKQMELEIKRLPHVSHILTSIGEEDGSNVNDGLIYVKLTPEEERSLKQADIMSMARKAFSKYAGSGLRISVMYVPTFSGGGFKASDFTYVVSGPDLEQLKNYSTAIVEGLKQIPGAVDLDTSLVFAKPEYKVLIDRDRAQDLGVKVEDIANSLRTMVGGEEDITKYKDKDELYQVRLRVDKNYRNNKESINALYIPSSKLGLVRLDTVATLKEDVGPAQIDRINRQRQVTITANLQGATLGELVTETEKIVKDLKLSADYKTFLLGKAKEMGKMMKGFLFAFLLALIFMYMVLAAQFESFLHPITIMLSLPLSIPFALLSLLIMGQHLTIYSFMGLFMLFGIVKKNAILQVDYTNTLREQGMPRDQAIIEANKTRLRPILMTTIVLVAAMLPVAFGKGPGASSRATMAVVIVGGQTLCLAITLLMTPVAYSLFDDMTQKFKKILQRRRQ